MRTLEHRIPEEENGWKIYDLLRKNLNISANLVKRNKRYPDGILLDGIHATTRDRVRTGQQLSFRLSDYGRNGLVIPAPGEISILYEDEDLILLNKPAGTAVHPSPGHLVDTLGNYLLSYYDSKGETTDFHPVHRLDIGTSGLLIIAKHVYAQDFLMEEMHTDRFQRFYLALCEGRFEQKYGKVEAPIARETEDSLNRVIREDGQYACTHYEVISEKDNRSLVRLKLETGRTHQIRVHMASLGHPLLGDAMYGGDISLLSRPALHSSEMIFVHPMTKEILHFSYELPQDMKKIVED